MSFPTLPPKLTQAEAVDAITEAEAGIAQCLQLLLCNTLVPAITEITDPDKQAALTKTILSAYIAKENSMGNLIDSLSRKVLADK